jgi:hypothetical protein
MINCHIIIIVGKTFEIDDEFFSLTKHNDNVLQSFRVEFRDSLRMCQKGMRERINQ